MIHSHLRKLWFGNSTWLQIDNCLHVSKLIQYSIFSQCCAILGVFSLVVFCLSEGDGTNMEMKMLDFKVCLKDIDHHIEDEVKRFEIEEDECNLLGVLTKIEQTFPVLLQHEYYISWVDQVWKYILEVLKHIYIE